MMLGGRCSGVLVSGLRGLGPILGIVLCYWGKYFPLHSSLHIQEYNWIPLNGQASLMKCRGGGPWGGQAYYPGVVVILLITSCYGSLDKTWLIGLLSQSTEVINIEILHILFIQCTYMIFIYLQSLFTTWKVYLDPATSSVVFITARMASIFVSSTAVHIYMIFLYLQ